MPECPRCHQPVKTEAVTCPYCRNVLKAYGHPGIPLHQATGDKPLCDTCTYHEDDTCNFPQRPYARECTLYQNSNAKQLPVKPSLNTLQSIRLWFQGNLTWLLLLSLILFSFLLVLSQRR